MSIWLFFLDGVVRQFSQFVVTQQEVDATGELGDGLGDVFQKCVRHAAAVGRVGRAAVADFLDDEVAFGVVSQVGDASDGVEVVPMTVEVAGNHHFFGGLRAEHDDVSHAVRILPIDTGSLGEVLDDCLDELDRRNHGSLVC